VRRSDHPSLDCADSNNEAGRIAGAGDRDKPQRARRERTPGCSGWFQNPKPPFRTSKNSVSELENDGCSRGPGGGAAFALKAAAKGLVCSEGKIADYCGRKLRPGKPCVSKEESSVISVGTREETTNNLSPSVGKTTLRRILRRILGNKITENPLSSPRKHQSLPLRSAPRRECLRA
jgi:hypothetical protein